MVPGQQPVLAATVASVFGQQPVLAAASPVFGQQSGAAWPAQQGLSQSAGQSVFGQLPDSAQHGLLESSGQVFSADPHAAFWAHSTLAFSAEKACEAAHVAFFVP